MFVSMHTQVQGITIRFNTSRESFFFFTVWWFSPQVPI
jgi:hypothetical protein